MFSQVISNIGEYNPQLFRELKGKLKVRNLAIATVISLIGQGLVYLVYQAALPHSLTQPDHTNRYCIGNFPGEIPVENDYYYNQNNFCARDALGNFNINWELWNLDIFICLSIAAIFILILAGSYLLITDISNEEERGTFNFIRLTPQAAQNIFLGKIIGVPVLVYFVCLLALPWHFFSGLSATIPLSLILSFYPVLIISSVFFYHIALFYTSFDLGLGNFKAWLASSFLFLILYLITGFTFGVDEVLHNAFDWPLMFSPATALIYLVNATNVSNVADYLDIKLLNDLNWFNLHIWQNPVTGIAFMIASCLICTYWLGQGIKQRFYNPYSPALTKKQSYLLTAIVTIILLGFTMKWGSEKVYSENIFNKVAILLCLNFFFCLILSAILAPARQSLQDWSRYHHQTNKKRRNLWRQLIFAENSPSILAVAINFAIASIISLPALFLFTESRYVSYLLFGLVLQFGLVVIFATIIQMMLILKTKKRTLFAAITLLSLILCPIIISGIFQLAPTTHPNVWLFSVAPMFAIEKATSSVILMSAIAQWVTILVLNLQTIKTLGKLGQSHTKELLTGVRE